MQCQAALSLVNLTEAMTDTIEPPELVEGLINRLVELVRDGPRYVKEESSTSLGKCRLWFRCHHLTRTHPCFVAYLALVAGDAFVPFARRYPVFIQSRNQLTNDLMSLA